MRTWTAAASCPALVALRRVAHPSCLTTSPSPLLPCSPPPPPKALAVVAVLYFARFDASFVALQAKAVGQGEGAGGGGGGGQEGGLVCGATHHAGVQVQLGWGPAAYYPHDGHLVWANVPAERNAVPGHATRWPRSPPGARRGKVPPAPSPTRWQSHRRALTLARPAPSPPRPPGAAQEPAAHADAHQHAGAGGGVEGGGGRGREGGKYLVDVPQIRCGRAGGWQAGCWGRQHRHGCRASGPRAAPPGFCAAEWFVSAWLRWRT